MSSILEIRQKAQGRQPTDALSCEVTRENTGGTTREAIHKAAAAYHARHTNVVADVVAEPLADVVADVVAVPVADVVADVVAVPLATLNKQTKQVNKTKQVNIPSTRSTGRTWALITGPKPSRRWARSWPSMAATCC